MELRLQEFIRDLEHVAKTHGMAANNPVVTRLSRPALASLTVVVLAEEEPDTQILPLNVTWINLDPTSSHFRRALRRVSKTPVAPYNHEYEVLDLYDDVFVEQYYDAGDEAIVSSGGVTSAATTSELGLVKLTAAPADPQNPVVVENTDPRLADARVPTAHTHPQEPAASLATTGTNVVINGSTPPTAGMLLFAVSGTEATWRFATTADVQP